MLKIALFSAVVLVSGSLGICGELVLRIDTFGYEDADRILAEREAKLLQRTEIAVEANKKFLTRCHIGQEEIELRGVAHNIQDGVMKLDVQYRTSKGQALGDGTFKNSGPLLQSPSTSVSASLNLKLGVISQLGTVKQSRGPNGSSNMRHTSKQILATLIEVEPDVAQHP